MRAGRAHRRGLAAAAVLLTGILLFPEAAPGQALAGPPYTLRPAEVAVPDDAEIGQYQRTIRPFENWTLICDANLAEKTKVCNVTQTIEDRNGKMAFSWSLAATKAGKPYMILRTAPVAVSDGSIRLAFGDRADPVDVGIDGCNATVCVGMVPVGPVMRSEIGKNATPTISYPVAGGRQVSVKPTLAGLSDALAAIE